MLALGVLGTEHSATYEPLPRTSLVRQAHLAAEERNWRYSVPVLRSLRTGA
jgi:hypothetical protein